MYSHSGATQRTASAERPQLWLATLQPGIVPALAADAMDKLRARLWYLVVHENTYRIDSQPNLNQILVTRMDAIRQEPETIRERIKVAVEEIVGERTFPGLVIGPDDPGQATNRRLLRGLFAYALGDGADFDTIYFRDTLPSGGFAIGEGAWLLRPALAGQLLKKEAFEPEPTPEPGPIPSSPPPLPGPQPVPPVTPPPPPQPIPPPTTYRRVTIKTPVDWRQ